MAGVVVAYTAAFVLSFERFYDTVEISSIALVGLVVWLYGMRAGFISVPLFILLNTLVLWHVSGKWEDIMLTYNPLAICIGLAVIITTGAMKNSSEKLEQLRRTLSQRVDDETRMLESRVAELVELDETERIRWGQALHDGIGQLLTGMLLHSEALAEQLARNKRPEAEQAKQIRNRIQADISFVRKLSRSLVPNHLEHAGLQAALNELVDYFRSSSTARFNLDMAENADERIPPSIALHLYRIAQEVTNCMHNHASPETIGINLSCFDDACTLSIAGQTPCAPPTPNCLSKLIEYRIRSIGGEMKLDTTPDGRIAFQCRCPLTPEVPA